MIGRSLLLAALLALPPAAEAASPTSNGQSVSGLTVDTVQGRLLVGSPNRTAVTTAFDGIAPAFRSYAQMAAQALAEAGRQIRDRSLPEALPMPPPVRQALLPFFPAEILDRIRWTVADPNRISLGAVMSLNKDVEALTIDQVIVFADCRLPRDRLDLWAHEIVHVLQYQTMGLDDFATVYLASAGDALEKEAYAWQDFVRTRLNGVKAAWPPDQPLPPPCG